MLGFHTCCRLHEPQGCKYASSLAYPPASSIAGILGCSRSCLYARTYTKSINGEISRSSTILVSMERAVQCPEEVPHQYNMKCKRGTFGGCEFITMGGIIVNNGLYCGIITSCHTTSCLCVCIRVRVTRLEHSTTTKRFIEVLFRQGSR